MGLRFQNNVTTSCGDKIDPRRAAVGSPVSEEDFLSVLGQIKPHRVSDLISTDEEGDVWLCPAVTTPGFQPTPPPTLCNALFCTLLLRLEQGTSSKISPPTKKRHWRPFSAKARSIHPRVSWSWWLYVSTATIISGGP